ncbi:hypothetical protein FPZ24_15710 [Sphingomonas panacisoli]|uniref:Uncharacterized protein n=1 Tax=Sphingomonas panacisoli TaxID=1813879 RepID=A0A5B8LM51_9SPHN|nr:hypothetical protein [Sphingomonas panacisoli]QDZ08735.1 hypothetical protein FPZ24_15710 [Sphingomonas panacisoli]
MDLSYLRFEHDASVAVLPPDLAVLLVGVAARQAASPTAIAHAQVAPAVIADLPFRPASGAFDEGQAVRIERWSQE